MPAKPRLFDNLPEADAPSPAAVRARQKRVQDGAEQRRAEAQSFAAGGDRAPTHKQLLLPLLKELQVRGGRAKPGELYDALADRFAVSEDIRSAEVTYRNGRTTNLWTRHVRWARQTAVAQGLIADRTKGVWELAEGGRNVLENATPGIIVTVFETSDGFALWAHAEDAAAVIERGSLDLIFTSPPYPMLTDKRGYGTMDTASWLDWMTDLGSQWKELLTDTGSLVVNLGPAWFRGTPTQSAYLERFTLRMLDDVGYHLADRLYWENPSKLPAPRPWVAIRRMRVRPSVETLLWFSKTAWPKADNRNVLVPYAETTVERWIGNEDAGGVIRPSGHDIGKGSFARDNGGAIPGSVIRVAAGASRDVWRQKCREAGVPLHPATMPGRVAEFVIKLTTDEGDVVYDPFFGSGTTGAVARRLGRRWIGSERARVYLRGAALRFDDAPCFRPHFD